MAASSAALLTKLAGQVRALREQRGWTQAQLAGQLRLPVEDVIDLERQDFGDEPIAATGDGSSDIAPSSRRRWLTRMGIALEMLAREGPGWNERCLTWIRTALEASDRARLRELLVSDEELDWWAGIRFAALVGDKDALPFVRELARAPAWSVSAHTRSRAEWALFELGASDAGRIGGLSLADPSQHGALELATAAGAMSISRSDPAGDSSRRRERLGGIAAGAHEADGLLTTYEAARLAINTTVEVAMIFLFSSMVGWLVHAGLAAILPGWLATVVALAIIAALVFLSAVVFLRETRRNVFTWTRKRWARNRAQRLRGS